MKNLFLFAVVIFVSIISSCKNHSPKTASEILTEVAKNPNLNIGNKNYIVDIPSGWRQTDTSISGVKMYIVYAPVSQENNFHTNFKYWK